MRFNDSKRTVIDGALSYLIQARIETRLAMFIEEEVIWKWCQQNAGDFVSVSIWQNDTTHNLIHAMH